MTSFLVAAKIAWISAVDLGAFGLVLGLGLAPSPATTRAAPRPWRLHARHAGRGLHRGVGLARRETCCSCSRNSPGRLCECCAAACLASSACQLGLVRLAQLFLGDLVLGHLLVGLVRAGREIDLLGRAPACGTAPAAGYGRRRPGFSGPIGATCFGAAFDWVGRRLGAVSMSFACGFLALRDQSGDLVLDLAGLPGLRVLVASLSFFGDFGLDRGLDRGDERLLVERARLLGVHLVDLSRLGLLGRRRRAALRGSCASFAFAAPAGAPASPAPAPFTAPTTWANDGSAADLTPGGGTGGASSWSEVSGAAATPGRHRPQPPSERSSPPRAGPAALGAPPFPGFAAALPNGLTFSAPASAAARASSPAPPRVQTPCAPRPTPTRAASAPRRPGRRARRRPSPP